uniref:histidine kinase n=1 Tax=Candidatus Kentrum sp. MB TaxID=2138164 RepID=A0A451BBH4_9GAMM|nr:MAG: His Kinase A (phospho-acceptor) domain-containing protein [Candidatus Kentron sp. MB]VFK75637.1 MAG: His Kinase A (phospho-acceptor) domain-containing protein [Candidatus Kentron sp. MB]
MANRTETFEKSYDVFIEYERTGKPFSIAEIAKAVGLAKSTIRTYLSKKWKSFITRESDGRYRVKGLAEQYTLEEYLPLMTQSESIRRLQQELSEKQKALVRSQQLSSLGVMASGLAHEIMQPVQSILLTAQNCRAETEESGLDAPYLMEDLDRIIQLAQRIDPVIEHLRLLARDQAPRSEPLALESLVADVFSLFGQQLKTHGVRVAQQFPPGLPPVFMDRVQLEQVFINLITNAREALEQGACQEKVITVRAEAREEAVAVEFSDTGCGIAPDNLDRLFEPFFTTREKGVGLGLHIVRDILTASGGLIQAGGAPDQGAIFTLLIPQYREQGPAGDA